MSTQAIIWSNSALVWIFELPLTPSTSSPGALMWTPAYRRRVTSGGSYVPLPNEALQFLLDGTVSRLRQELPPDVHLAKSFPLTRNIFAWVKERIIPKPTS